MISASHVTTEAHQAATSTLSEPAFVDLVINLVTSTRIWTNGVPVLFEGCDPLAENLKRLVVQDLAESVRIGQKVIVSKDSHISVHIYRVYNEEPCTEDSTINDEEIAFGRSWILPHASFEGLWESLHYEERLKEKSGKLVSSLFEKIREMLDDERILVFVMIDEVESLSLDRASCSSEPGDAIRVVNALLTQLDSLKAYPNVLVLATSNLIDSIDPALVDRADVMQYIPTPSQDGVYTILRSSLLELSEKNILKSEGVPIYDILPYSAQDCHSLEDQETELAKRLKNLASVGAGCAGDAAENANDVIVQWYRLTEL